MLVVHLLSPPQIAQVEFALCFLAELWLIQGPTYCCSVSPPGSQGHFHTDLRITPGMGD